MKKILVLMIFVFPLATLAQVRPMPKKPNIKTASKNENMRVEKPTRYFYLIIKVEEVKKSKKDEPSTIFKIESFDSRYSDKIYNTIKDKTSIIEVLNVLGPRGWELVSVDNENYYFKNSELAKKR
ncbi:MAG: hypothetical protein VXZ76_00725 [Bacteroidota bacterium]|nr:hypothetical protein [Bacteroidota bacterium]